MPDFKLWKNQNIRIWSRCNEILMNIMFEFVGSDFAFFSNPYPTHFHIKIRIHNTVLRRLLAGEEQLGYKLGRGWIHQEHHWEKYEYQTYQIYILYVQADPFYIITYYIKRITTSWTHSICEFYCYVLSLLCSTRLKLRSDGPEPSSPPLEPPNVIFTDPRHRPMDLSLQVQTSTIQHPLCRIIIKRSPHFWPGFNHCAWKPVLCSLRTHVRWDCVQVYTVYSHQ